MEAAAPTTVEDVADVLGGAAVDRRVVVARGAGTKSHWGVPPRECDLVVDLRRLDRVVDHAAGDMVVRVDAGVPLDRLARQVAGAGQQLAVDAPRYDDGAAPPSGTVGGALAVGLAGPRRLRYGGMRDLLLGMRMVRADGTVATSGGRVVKNVAGYDLGKLLCGSYGTLGVLVEATLRLHPLPAATAWVTATADDAARAYACARAVLDSQLMPSAVEVDRPGTGGPVTVAALFEGTRDGVAARAEAAAVLTGGAVRDGPPEWFGRCPGDPAGSLLDVATPPAALAQVIAAVDAAGQEHGAVATVRGSAGVGTLQVSPEGAEATALGGFVAALRERLAPHGGHVVVRHAPPPVRDVVDPWGPVHPGALALMRRVKAEFDPHHLLAPGRFVGGI